MNKRWLVGGLAAAIVLLVARSASRSNGSFWRTALERMPESAPPRWMFENISAIRENGERILERLDESTRDIATSPLSNAAVDLPRPNGSVSRA
jgi:hypothetical protein